ncbi:MAG: type II secretion system F family protein [Bacteroidota bacterium]
MRFAYKAVGPDGRKRRGHLEAGNIFDLESRLKRMDLVLISGQPLSPGSRFGQRQRLARRQMISFCFHLEQLTSAGIPLLDGLQDLRDSTAHPGFRDVVGGLIEGIEGGQTLSQALADQPAVFNRVFVNLINAGEVSGHLPEVLHNLAESLKWEDELAAHNRKLLLYPSFVAAIVLAATLFLMIYMVPQLKVFVKNLGQVLPAQTRLLFFLADRLAEYWPVFLLLPVLAVAGSLLVVRRSRSARLRLDALKLHLPIVGGIINKIILSRFANTLAMLYAAGIPVIEAIATTRLIVGNRMHQQALQQVEESVRTGRSISNAFHEAGIFPPLVVRMLRVGENTGKLDSALRNVSYFYNRDVGDAVARLQAMIEPTLTVSLGLILGWIMWSVIAPIYDVISRIKL